MQMSLHDYENITLGQFINKLTGFFNFHNDKEEYAWKRFAYVAYSIMMNNPHIKQHQKPKSFDAFLNQGKKTVVKITTEEQLNAFLG